MNPVVLLISVVATLLLMGVVALWSRNREQQMHRAEHRVVEVLELVLSGQADERDWTYLESMPLRRNARLETIRQNCLEIAEREYQGNPYRLPGRPLFSMQGLQQLEVQLADARRALNDV